MKTCPCKHFIKGNAIDSLKFRKAGLWGKGCKGVGLSPFEHIFCICKAAHIRNGAMFVTYKEYLFSRSFSTSVSIYNDQAFRN